MRLPIVTVLASFAPIVAADFMIVLTKCVIQPWCNSQGTWYTGYGAYTIDANEGCRDPVDVSSMNTLCMDWGNQRGHFFFDNQPKRCIRKTSEDLHSDIWLSRWEEVACTW